MTNRRFDKADFNGIVENLIEYLSSQNQFKDYNFEASGIRTIIELLAYNTQYQLFYLNQVANESFLDSATIRESAVSLAKHLGYKPRSVRSSKSIVNITINSSGVSSPPPYLILKNTNVFSATGSDGVKYFFSPIKNYFSELVGGLYTFNNVELLEGKRLSHTFVVDTEDSEQKFILPNTNIDDRSLVVTVSESETSLSKSTFKQHVNLTEIDDTSKIYFLQETNLGYLELIFGDGVIGQKLENGNVIEVSYIVSSGENAYNATIFRSVSGIDNFTNINIETVEAASKFIEQESIESIKKLAPMSYETQDRAVTKSDYELLLTKDIADLEFLRVWGGEENDPPINGVVFISAKPKDRSQYSTQEKEYILNSIVKSRSLISVESRFVDPDIINLKIVSNVRYDANSTSQDPSEIQNLVLQSINSFKDQYLTGFDFDFRYSKLIQSINESDPSVLSNLTTINLKYRLTPPLNTPKNYAIHLNNQIDTGDVANNIHSINSSGFIFGGIETFIQDDGKGSLEYYRIVDGLRKVIKQNVGTVDYSTGTICITDLSVQSLPNGVTYLDIFATPEKNDVIAEKNQIIVLDDFDIQIFIEAVQ